MQKYEKKRFFFGINLKKKFLKFTRRVMASASYIKYLATRSHSRRVIVRREWATLFEREKLVFRWEKCIVHSLPRCKQNPLTKSVERIGDSEINGLSKPQRRFIISLPRVTGVYMIETITFWHSIFILIMAIWMVLLTIDAVELARRIRRSTMKRDRLSTRVGELEIERRRFLSRIIELEDSLEELKK